MPEQVVQPKEKRHRPSWLDIRRLVTLDVTARIQLEEPAEVVTA